MHTVIRLRGAAALVVRGLTPLLGLRTNGGLTGDGSTHQVPLISCRDPISAEPICPFPTSSAASGFAGRAGRLRQ